MPGRRVLVTGGSRGIGRATVLAFAGAGARVATCCRTGGEDAEALARALKETGADHRIVFADVTSRGDVAALAQTCREAFGGLDVLVNNAGVDGRCAIGELSEQEWARVMDVNVTAYFLVAQAVLPLLGPGAAIVNVGSSAALRGRPESAHHTASKAAVIGLTRSLAKELGARQIRVNAVAPGVIESGPRDLPPPLRERIRALTALGRTGTPADVSGAVLFLASEAARYVTGVTLNVDGGM